MLGLDGLQQCFHAMPVGIPAHDRRPPMGSDPGPLFGVGPEVVDALHQTGEVADWVGGEVLTVAVPVVHA